MTRVSLLDADQAPLLAQPAYADGDPGPLVAALAHVPEVLEVALPFLGTVLGPSSIDLRTKEIVILRASARLGCTFCTQTHTVVARDSGLSLDEVRALRGEADLATFAEARDRAIIDWTDAVAQGPGEPDQAVIDALRAHVAEHTVVELTLLVGATVMLNRFATALRLPTGRDALDRLAEEGLR